MSVRSLLGQQRALGKRGLARTFVGLQRLGVDVLPRHFYSGVPDILHLQNSERWRRPRSMVEVRGADVADQTTFARETVTPEVTAVLASTDIHAAACAANGAAGYGPVEADFLYAFIREHRPAKVIQVGAGVSTAVILRAAADAGYHCEVVAIDPYPTDYLRSAPIRLIADDVQNVELSELTDLGDGDLFFVDSTHTVKVDSEVNLIVLEVLPRLGKGVWTHFHDVTFPYDYQRDILSPPLFFWLESTLIHAFLIGNQHFRIAASLSMLHHRAPDALAALIPRYTPEVGVDGLGSVPPRGHFPSSLYLLRA